MSPAKIWKKAQFIQIFSRNFSFVYVNDKKSKNKDCL